MDAPPVDSPAGLPAAPPPSGFRVNRWAMAAGLGGVVVLGLGAVAIAVALALKPAAGIDRMVPASVDGCVAAYLDPSLSQKLNLLGLAHRFPDLKTDADMTAAVDRYLDHHQRSQDRGHHRDRGALPGRAGPGVIDSFGLLYVDFGAVAAAARPLLPPSAQRDYDRKLAARLGRSQP